MKLNRKSLRRLIESVIIEQELKISSNLILNPGDTSEVFSIEPGQEFSQFKVQKIKNGVFSDSIVISSGVEDKNSQEHDHTVSLISGGDIKVRIGNAIAKTVNDFSFDSRLVVDAADAFAHHSNVAQDAKHVIVYIKNENLDFPATLKIENVALDED